MAEEDGAPAENGATPSSRNARRRKLIIGCFALALVASPLGGTGVSADVYHAPLRSVRPAGAVPTSPRAPAEVHGRPRVAGTDNYSAAVLADNPVSYWRFNETSGTTAADQEGRYPGTIDNGITLGLAGPVVPDGKAFLFSGGPIVELGTALGLMPPNNWSVEMWVKDTSNEATVCTVSNIPCELWKSRAYGTELYFTHTGALEISFSASSTTGYSATSANAYDDDQWHYVVAVRAATSLSLYVDDALVASTAVGEPTSYYCCELLVGIGGDPCFCGGGSFGEIAEPAFYNYALSASRVAAHFLAAGTSGQLTSQQDPTNGNGSIPQSCGCQAPSGGFPINTASGAFYHSFTDFSVPGRGIPVT